MVRSLADRSHPVKRGRAREATYRRGFAVSAAAAVMVAGMVSGTGEVDATPARHATLVPRAGSSTHVDTAASIPGVQSIANGVIIHPTAGGTERIQVCGDRILRVSDVAQGDLPAKQSLVVNAAWPTHPHFVVRPVGADSVVVATADVQAHVDLGSGLVAFTDAAGRPLTSERAKTFGPSPSQAPGAEQQVSTLFNSPVNEGLFGLGQHQDGVMDDKGHNVTLDQFNTGGVGGDVAVPVLISSRGYGLMWDTYSRADFSGGLDDDTAYGFSAESDNMVDYYFMYGPSIDQVVRDYRTATGPAPMFPLWAYGLFQSYDHYTSQQQILDVAQGYRSQQIPLDAIVQDWQYWSPAPWNDHVMDPTRYPDPADMLNQLHAENLHGMISVWPNFDPGSADYSQLADAGCFYQNVTDGGHQVYDPYSTSCRAIYSQQIQSQLVDSDGWDALWLDADEFETSPGARADVTTALGPGVDYYNAYPLEHTQAVFDGWKADPAVTGKRPFILSRSAYAGQQRNAAATWSGDTSASFGELANQMSGGLNYSISGLPYWTEDIGGYFANGDWSTPANNELFARWFEKGAFDPIFRIHGQGSRELYGSQWSATTKQALLETDQLRYRLMPYIYSVAAMVTQDGYTMMRPLVMDYRNDPAVYHISDEYMFGPSLLIAPVTAAGVQSRQVYLPHGLWYDFWTGRPVEGGQTITAPAPYDHIPVYVRAGSVLPLGSATAQYAAQAVSPTEIRVYPGANGQFTLYSDAGDGDGYTHGAFERIPLTYRASSGTLTIGHEQGRYPGMPATRRLRVVTVHPGEGDGVASSPDAPATTYRGHTTVVVARSTGESVGESISVPTQPQTAGSPLTVTTDTVNAGTTSVRDVSVQLDTPAGWSATPQTSATLRSLAAGHNARVTWTVTAAPPADPMSTADITGQASFIAPHGTRGTVAAVGTLTLTSPVQAPYQTTASTTAYFGQAGARFTIDADGADIFNNGAGALDDQYGAIYQPGGAGPSSTATVRVDAQADTDPWAKAGLVMRNDLTQPSQATGYVALVVTPGNGVSLQWDSDGDGVLDQYTQVGVGTLVAPIWLKLTRSGTTFTGYYSPDGTTWTSVGSTTVTSAAATQDVGMIATAHSAGVLGRDDFSDFVVQ